MGGIPALQKQGSLCRGAYGSRIVAAPIPLPILRRLAPDQQAANWPAENTNR